jgi:carbamoyl-phosphate synthase large subunit
MNILITSAGKRVSLVRAFQNELKTLFPASKVLTTDMHPDMSAACVISDGSFKVCAVSDRNYVSQLLDICRKNAVTMVVPTIDTELVILADNRERFRDFGIYVVISSSQFVAMCRDKRKTAEFFQVRGITVPRIMDRNRLTYPLFIKPYDGSLSADTHVIRSEADLRPEFFANEKLLFMEYYSKEHYDEYTVDMYYDRHNTCRCIVPRKRLSVRAGEVNKGVTCYNEIVPHLKAALGKVEGAVGCITAQFFMHKEVPLISGIEINARFGGGYPLSYHAGANYPLWLIREYFLQENIDYSDNWQHNMLMLRYDDEIIVHANQYKPQQLLRF